MKTFTAYVEWDTETELFSGLVPGISGAHSQAKTIDELKTNLQEVLELCIENINDAIDNIPKFIGLLQIEVDG